MEGGEADGMSDASLNGRGVEGRQENGRNKSLPGVCTETFLVLFEGDAVNKRRPTTLILISLAELCYSWPEPPPDFDGSNLSEQT